MAPIVVAPPSDIVDQVYNVLINETGLITTYCKVYSVTKTKALRVAMAYAQFLSIKIVMYDFDDTMLIPPKMVDDMWCTHMLSTKLKYTEVCEQICGRIVHHEPAFTDNKEHFHGRLTKGIADLRFGQALDQEIWSYEFEALDKTKGVENKQVNDLAANITPISKEGSAVVPYDQEEIANDPEISIAHQKSQDMDRGVKITLQSDKVHSFTMETSIGPE
jgi:hypothetical protein